MDASATDKNSLAHYILNKKHFPELKDKMSSPYQCQGNFVITPDLQNRWEMQRDFSPLQIFVALDVMMIMIKGS